MNLLRWISMIGVLAVMVPATLTGQDSQTANPAEARKVIQDGGTRVFAIRVAVTNHRSTRADFRLLVNQVLKLGRDLQGEDGQL